MNIPTDKIISHLTSIGVPSLILLRLISMSPYFGAAAVTGTLASFGGIVGGIISFGVIVSLSKIITDKGIEYIFAEVTKRLMKKGLTKQDIIDRINNYPISKKLKYWSVAQLTERHAVNVDVGGLMPSTPAI